MKLQVGERLEGAGPDHQPGGYVVTSIVRETPWHGLYTGKKIFYNFDFTAKRVRETDDVEWLDVFLRTNRYPILDDPAYVQQRRALARAEVRAILGNRHSNLWPEPLDLLEIENTRDPFAFSADAARGAEPIVVYTRPHGRFTADWQHQIVPIASVLSVLAELLEFMQQAHFEGLLLLGLGPASLLIDESDRVHFVGTEMVLSQQSPLLRDSTPAATWQRLFPADRFVRGFAAPECYDSAKRPDVRSDLYAWGAVAFSLLTGADLSKTAQEQGRPWITYTETHWNQLERTLAQLPRNSLTVWADQIGVDPNRLLSDWPRNLLTVFRMLMSPDPARRPRSTGELLSWLVAPPPPPVAGIIALHTDGDTAKLLLDCTGIDTGMDITIQCNRGAPAREPSEGMTVAQGPVLPVIGITNLPLTTEPIYYTAFTRRHEADQTTYSPGVSAQLWQPTAVGLRQWVDAEAGDNFETDHIPSRVGMVLGALDIRLTTESLLGSALPRVHAWGLRRLEQTLRTQGYTEMMDALLSRFLTDPNADVRQSAAATFWAYQPHKTDDRLLDLIQSLETPPIDAPIPLMQFLRQLHLPDERVRTVLQQLESKQPTECPLCKKPLTLGQRGAHLQTEHGYLYYQGDLLPAQAVFTKLWERAFQQDRHAHEELASMYTNLPEARNQPDAAAQRYLADLQRYLLGTGDIPVALPYAAIVAYQTNLRLSRLFVPIARRLLVAPQKRLRDLGCQTVLPFIQEQLPPRPRVDDLRRWLGEFCGELDNTDLQIDLCRQLGQLGVDQALVGACASQLQDERLVVCSECHAEVQLRDLELHLRRAHQIFQFRGTRKTYVDVRSAILKAVCTAPPDLAAWKSLQALAVDKHPQETDRYIVAWVYQFIKDVEADQRGPIITALADVLIAADAVERMLPLFVSTSKNATWGILGQRIGLEMCTRLPGPVPDKLLPLLTPLLDVKDLPRRSRENGVLALLRSLDKESPIAADVLRAYVVHSSKKRGVEKLTQIEQRFGHHPALDKVTQEIDNEIRMSCPRCPTELRKKDMVGHLWDRHHLVLDGQRVREPWRVIEDWVVDYGLEKDPHVLQRCRELALKDDPQTGLAKLQRLLYRRGLRDRELLSELRGQIKARNATLCPHCCAMVPIEEPATVEPLTLEESRLTGFGYVIEVSERGLFPSLQVESPDTILFRGREPGRGLTRKGGIVFMVAPLMALMFCVLSWFVGHALPPPLVATVAVGVGMLWAGFLFLAWPSPRPPKERLIKAAWNLLVPEIVREKKKGRREWSFLVGLVEISEDAPHLKLDEDQFLGCCEQASDAARTDPIAAVCLAALSRRYLADMRDGGQDPFDFVLTLTSECFKGKIPLAFLNDLLRNFHGPDRAAWSKCDLHRLPILVAFQAFIAEIDVDDWFNLGRAFPVVSGVLNLAHRWHWLQVFALWDQRSRRPWERLGEAKTLFELAKSPQQFEELLSFYPDVLLYIAKANVVIGSKGVWIEGVCITSFPSDAEVLVQRTGGGFELHVGALRVHFAENPRPFVDDIERCLNWYFHEFVPSVADHARPLLESRHRMWQLSKTACPECGRPLVPCLADLGVALK